MEIYYKFIGIISIVIISIFALAAAIRIIRLEIKNVPIPTKDFIVD